MNQSRCWPGVPNRKRVRSVSNEIRPKSIATVVLVLSGVWLRSSTPALAAVTAASVRTGGISETAPTNVVFPTPKPPATMIFVDNSVDAWTLFVLLAGSITISPSESARPVRTSRAHSPVLEGTAAAGVRTTPEGGRPWNLTLESLQEGRFHTLK